MNSAKERLHSWLREHPDNPCAAYGLADIARDIGVTRERVRQLLPPEVYARSRGRQPQQQFQEQQQLAAFIEAHPGALVPPGIDDAGMYRWQIAEALGWTRERLHRVWTRMELPSHEVLTAAFPSAERVKERYRRRPAYKAQHDRLTKRWQQAHPAEMKATNERARARRRSQKLISAGT